MGGARRPGGEPAAAPAGDPPGEGINRRRPLLLAAALIAMALWLAYLIRAAV